MQKQSWSLTNEGHVVLEEDDDNDVQLGNNTFFNRNAKTKEHDEEEEDQQTLKAEHTQKTARQTMIERKLHDADLRAQTFT